MTNPPGWTPPPGDPFEGFQQPTFQEPLTYPSGYIPQQQQPWPGGYGGPPGYGGYEAPPLDSPPPNRKRLALILGTISLVVVVAVVLGGALWWLNTGDDEDNTPVAQTTSAVATTEPTTTTSAATSAPPAAAPSCEGRIAHETPETPAGWIPVASPRGLNYAVPGDWEVNSCTTLVGWEKSCPEGPFGTCPIRTMSGSAQMPNKQCPDGLRAVTGVPGAKNAPDINEAVQLETQTVADIYTSKNGVVPSVSLSPPRSFTIAGTPAVQIVATVTGIEGDECTGTSALHSMVATTVPGQPGSVLFVVSLEQGYPGAPDPGMVDQLVGTLTESPS